MSFIKKENLTIVIGEYEKNGQMKKEYKTIGELVTMQGNDGIYQFGRLWGPTGTTEFKVFEQQDRTVNQSAAPQQQQAHNNYQAPPPNSHPQQAPGLDDFDDDIPF